MTSIRVRALTLTGLVASTALVLAGCAGTTLGTGGSSSSAPSGGVYSIGLSAPDGNIDPVLTSDYNAMFIVGLASAGLIIESPSGKLEPQLATSWTASDDGLTWTVKLREGAKFSNGDPVTVNDVVASFDSIISPKSQSPAASSFAGILKSVATGSANSVEFALDQKYGDFPYLLTGANTSILPAGTDDTNWITHPVGAGQFLVSKYTVGQGVTFVKNPNYWDATNVNLTGVNVKFYADTQSQLLAFQSGEIDQISGSPAVTAALAAGNYGSITQGYQGFDGLTFNTTKKPFDDVSVRQAIAYALDRKAIVKTIYGGEAQVGNDIATFPDYGVQPTGVDQRGPNAAKVKKLLNGRTIRFTITTYDGEQPLAELIQQQLQAVGGFAVTLDIQTRAKYYGGDDKTTPWLNAPVTITDWANRLPAQLISLAYSTGAVWNAAHYSNPTLDSLAKEYEATTEASTRQSIANKIATIQSTDVSIIVAAFKKNSLYLSKKVKGSFQNGQNFNGGFDFRGISVSK